MKAVLIKWRRSDQYEDKGQRHAAVRNAHRTVRQQTRKQLREIAWASSTIDKLLHNIFDYPHDPERAWETFEQPRVRLGYFD